MQPNFFPVKQETCLIEAFNLRAAIEHTRKNYEMAVEALSDMPPRREQELDPVTLHNQACISCPMCPRTVVNQVSVDDITAEVFHRSGLTVRFLPV